MNKNQGKTIVITGCSSGFGRVTALYFARLGWDVFATFRKQADIDDFGMEAAAQSAQGSDWAGCPMPEEVLCDITQPAGVEALRAAVFAKTDKVDVLVNNAGTAFPGPLELLPLADLRAQLEINLIAHVAVTQALLPLLRAAQGTVINVSSMGGKIAFPITGAYHASKFALEGLSDSWRIELAPFGVKVVVVEPGGSPTAIWATGEQKARGLYSENDTAKAYAPLIAQYAKLAARSAKEGFPPFEFAALVEKIAHNPRPAARYALGKQVGTRILFRRLLPDWWWDNTLARLFKWKSK